jgi:SPX domain protein involved in polyphosphate accumulation
LLQKYFKRFEIKYQISLQERDILIKNLTPFMKLDDHIKNSYDYEIRSIYFDSIFHKAYYEKSDGIKTRRKLRIRFYPDFYQKEDAKMVFIEIKRKMNENVSKARILVPLEDVFEIIQNKSIKAKQFYKDASTQDKKVIEEIWYLKDRYNLKPVCVVSYNRQAYMGKIESRFRITFDTNLYVRNHNFDLNIGSGNHQIVPKNTCVMEIKFNNLIPNWAIGIIQNNDCLQQKISKFASGLKKTRSYTLV